MRFLLPAAILAAGVAAFLLLTSLRTQPPRMAPVVQDPLVETVQAAPGPVRVLVRAQGTVRPDREIDLVPQVGGRIVWISDQMEAGGFFAAGQVLARIDPEDFELAVDQTEAEVARARYQLEIARGEAEVAGEEWERLEAGGPEPSSLALHIPQMRLAEAALKAAQARLREARLHLERTRLQAPFAGRVRSTELDLGQYVSPGRAVARLYGTERAEVPVPVPDEELAWIDIPAPAPSSPHQAQAADAPPPELPRGATGPGQALLRARYAGSDHTWKGRVVRSEGQIDPRSRMVNLVVEVDDPYGAWSGATAPLMAGLFVDVEIQGRPLQDVRTIPRRALHAGGVVWLAVDGRLRLQPVEVVRVGREEALVRFDAESGARVITSQLKGVTDGMAVRRIDRVETP